MAEPEAPRPLRVLLVDPLPGTRVTTRAILEELGHEALAVDGWDAAEDLLLREDVDAVVMAFAAEGFDGRAAALRLRDRLPPQADLPLVGTTSGLRRGEEQEALEAGFDVLVVRPFAPDALAEAIAQAVRDRAPPPLLDPERRAALRGTHGPEALARLDQAAMDAVAALVLPLFEHGGPVEDFAAAGARIAEILAPVGAVHAVAAARRMADNPKDSRRLLYPVMSAAVALRVALRKDRMTAAREDPIWAASETPPGDTP